MATTQKVTVTLQVEQVESIRALVSAGQAETVSGFVQHAVRLALDDIGGWADMLTEALEHTGGPMTDEERAWADDILGRGAARRGSG
ncbi:hypothetical protein MWU75_10380 [Ornithinimicrobium sp. F0845]|uniref:hypothetical protein n=1 Tax=Ornithinimicrobium sp. F0845 TaxID=2926412 RepID=UPI001FF59E3F|nr:hypothetical protein [Ornithinimicrobium sp. F0845]MCK0112545.1 hypothetical protein [Ornithinimicrobium sp. F0845]